MGFKFEDLRVWQSALKQTVEVYELSKSFPADERFNLVSQINRAADSVVLNIAEGSVGLSNKEFKRFLRIANRSALEVVSCLHIAKAKGFINQEVFDEYYSKYESLIISIQALIKSIHDD
jgi:four helix bundle protein